MGRKSIQRHSIKIINTSIKSVDHKSIQVLYHKLKKNEKDKILIEQIFQQAETLRTIKLILTKIEKDETDIYILSNYLKTLKNFMLSITQNQNEDFDINNLLKQMSNDLECEEYLKNTFIMRVGDIGKNFYVILSGIVSVLVPKNIPVYMTKKQYFDHLKMLFNYGEINLMERTFYNNCEIYPDIKLEDVKNEKKKKKKKKNKSLSKNMNKTINNNNNFNQFNEVYNNNNLNKTSRNISNINNTSNEEKNTLNLNNNDNNSLEKKEINENHILENEKVNKISENLNITEKSKENEKTKEQLLNLNKNKELNISKTIEENNKKNDENILNNKNYETLKINKKENKNELEREELLNPLIIQFKKNREKTTNEDEEFSLEKYISEINGEDIYREKFETNLIKLVGYFKVTELNEGSSFGEYALISDDQQRTASIFVNQNSIFGILSSNSYKKSLKVIQENNKKKDIDFVFSSKLFNQISIFVFSQNYWNYFIHKKIFMGDYLFYQGQERNEIYFLQEGEFKVTAYQLNHRKINLIISQLGNIKFEKIDYDDIGKNIDLPLNYCKKGDIIGTGDLLYNNKYFCSAICISKKANFFAINYNIFENICKYYQKVLENWKRIEIDKKILMIQKLQGVKFTNKNSLSGEFRKESENVIFWKENIEENELLRKYYYEEKKYSKFNLLNTIVNDFDKSLLNNRNTIIEKKIDPYSLNKLKLEKKNLPPLKTIQFNPINKKSNIIHKNTFSVNDIIAENLIEKSYLSKNIINTENNKNIKKIKSYFFKKKKDLAFQDLQKNILKNKEDIISKMILGKSIHGNFNDNFYIVKNEGEENEENIFKNRMKSPKKIINLKNSSSIKKSVLLKDLYGLKEYNNKKIRLRNSLNLDLECKSD